MLEGKVLELPTHLRHTEAVRERGVQIPRLLSDATALLLRQIVERAHVVEPVGQLHNDHARVLRNRQEQLPIALDLPLLRRAARGQLGDLGQPIDDARDLPAEFAIDVGNGDLRVFDDVMEQAAGNRDRIELEVGENLRDLHRMRDERLARIPHLAAMRLLAEPISARQQVAIELLMERMLILAPTRNELAFLANRDRSRRNRPASAKLVYRPRPTIT